MANIAVRQPGSAGVVRSLTRNTASDMQSQARMQRIMSGSRAASNNMNRVIGRKDGRSNARG